MKKANSLENASHVIYIMKQNVQAKLGHWKLTGLKLKHSVHKLRQIPWIIQKNVTSISSKTANEGKRFFALWIYSLKMFPANLSGFVTRHKEEKKGYLNGKKNWFASQTDELKTTRLYTSVFMTKVYRKKLNLQART